MLALSALSMGLCMQESIWTFQADPVGQWQDQANNFPWKEVFCAYGRKCVCACVCDTRSLRILRSLELTPPLCLCWQVQICCRGRQHHQTLAAPDPCPAAGGLDRPHPPDRGCSPPQAPCLPAAVGRWFFTTSTTIIGPDPHFPICKMWVITYIFFLIIYILQYKGED